MKAILVIYNPTAGSNDAKKLKSILKDNPSIELRRITPKLCQVIKQAAHSGCQTVIAVGGDGTVSAVAACVKDTPLRLGIIPAGTLNHFAKDLGIPLELDKALQIALHGKPQKIDVASVNGQIFINNSSIGLYPLVVQERDKQKAALGKWPAALLALLKILPRIKTYSVTITIAGKKFARTTPFIFLGNNSYRIDQFGFSNRTHLNRAELCLYLVNTSKILRILRIFLRALTGHVAQDRDFEAFHATEIEITLNKPALSVAYDGEVTSLRPPLRYKTEPKSLTVMMPR